MNADIAFAINAQLGNARDNLHRANLAARSSDPSKEWGQSGKTLQQIIDGYQSEVDRWERALATAP